MVLIAVMMVAAGLFAQQPTTQPVLIDVTDKPALEKAIGQEVTVQGIVSAAEWSRSGAVMNIDFKGAEQSRFLAVVFERSKDNFNTAFSGNFIKTIVGAKVRIRGKLEPYGGQVQSFRGRPQIILNRPDQVTIIEPAKP